MTTRADFVTAIADAPDDDTTRLVFADWLTDHGEEPRAAFVRASCEAAVKRPGTAVRATLLDRANTLLAEHEGEWLGEWRERLIEWEFQRGFLSRVRLTANTFLNHGEDLFRAEPVGRVELVDDFNEALGEDAVREVVAHPAFAFVRDCAVVPRLFRRRTPLHVWFTALAKAPHVCRLSHFGPVDVCHYEGSPNVRSDGLEEPSFAAFCQAEHLRTLRSLSLTIRRYSDPVSRPWLVAHLARATFARSLRSLTLVGCGQTSEEVRRLASDPSFGALEALDLTWNPLTPDAWGAIFKSSTLTAVTTLHVGADMLPVYVRSPMARRVRDLTVAGTSDLDRSLAPDRRAWAELIEHAPPPRRLVLECHNPGERVFAAMHEANWLRDVEELSISGDSQYEVYGELTGGICSLFDGKVMPRLVSLRFHEACDRKVLAALADWPGLAHLESLELTDDYYGRLVPRFFKPDDLPGRLRTLRGVVLSTDDDVDRLLAWPQLKRLTRLHLSFYAEYDQNARTYIERLSADTAERLLRSPALANLTTATFGFNYISSVATRIATVLASPAVIPRLRWLRLYGGHGTPNPALDGLRARFGPRLHVT
jgi:uncharacterized protein (TIGR02996 family)